jgi:hypothetical protein
VCCNFVNKELAPARYILFFVFVLAFGSRDGQDVSILGCMYKPVDILVLVYPLRNLMFSVPITKGSDN